jgi:branched-chain amino acid transport system permease protein
MLAVAFSIIYMTTRTINFALGPQMLVAALIYFTITFGGPFLGTEVGGGLPFLLSLVIAVVASILLGLLVHTLGLRPLGRFDPNSNIGWILTTLAIGLMLVEGGRLIFQEANRPVPPVIQSIAGNESLANIPLQNYLIFVVGIAVAIALETLHRKTKLGRGLRATAHDRNTAALMGINTNFMILYSFGLAGAIAAVAAWLIIPVTFVDFSALGTFIGLKSFVAAVVGGIGSTRGALIGGLVVGLAESMTVVFKAGDWRDAVVFVLLILILMVKPTGILGEARIEKV